MQYMFRTMTSTERAPHLESSFFDFAWFFNHMPVKLLRVLLQCNPTIHQIVRPDLRILQPGMGGNMKVMVTQMYKSGTGKLLQKLPNHVERFWINTARHVYCIA